MSGFFDDLGGALGSLAPYLGEAIGGAVGGPVGAAIGGKALGLVADALGLDDEEAKDPKKIKRALASATPEQLLAIKNAEREFAQQMRALDIKEFQIEVQDRSSARRLAQATSSVPQMVLSTLFLGGYFGLMYLFFTDTAGVVGVVSDFAKGQLGILIGVLAGSVPTILAFWFGSSRGSQEKTAHLAAAVQKAVRSTGIDWGKK